MKRSTALKATNKRSPQLAPMLAGQWGRGATKYWMRRDDGTWRVGWTNTGGWQGSRLTHIVFAFDLEDAFEETQLTQEITRVGIADDFYLVGSAARQAEIWPQLESALAHHGHRLRRTKCATLCPEADRRDWLDGVVIDHPLPTASQLIASQPFEETQVRPQAEWSCSR